MARAFLPDSRKLSQATRKAHLGFRVPFRGQQVRAMRVGSFHHTMGIKARMAGFFGDLSFGRFLFREMEC